MKVFLQRVLSASVDVEGQRIAEIGRGLLLLCGIGTEDDESKLAPMAKKLVELRVFANEEGRFDRSIMDISGEVLLVPQFTLFASTKKGRRPDFFGAMRPPQASELFDLFVAEFRALNVSRVEAGSFGADMKVGLVNDGPVSFMVES